MTARNAPWIAALCCAAGLVAGGVAALVTARPRPPRAATVRVEVSGPAVVVLTCGGAR